VTHLHAQSSLEDNRESNLGVKRLIEGIEFLFVIVLDYSMRKEIEGKENYMVFYGFMKSKKVHTRLKILAYQQFLN